MMQIRTVDSAYLELKKIDPDTAVTKNAIRTIVKSGVIHVVYSGKKAMFSLEELIAFLETATPQA